MLTSSFLTLLLEQPLKLVVEQLVDTIVLRDSGEIVSFFTIFDGRSRP